jgi:hypothetical protein
MKYMIFMFLSVLPLSSWASATGDLQRRIAAAYMDGHMVASDMPTNQLKGAAKARVMDLGTRDGWLDYYYGAIADGGPALKVVFVEFQYDIDGSGVVEVFHTNGNVIVRARFDEYQNLTWDIQP